MSEIDSFIRLGVDIGCRDILSLAMCVQLTPLIIERHDPFDIPNARAIWEADNRVLAAISRMAITSAAVSLDLALPSPTGPTILWRSAA
jgi:hypothetical protein